MSDSRTQQDLQKRRHSDLDPLESWKAIANYLHRSVRTVRRWEGDAGLPVHRHKHSSGSSVYAHRAELDAWRSTNRQPRQPRTAARPEKPSQRPDPALKAYAAIAMVAAMVGLLAGKTIFEDYPSGETVTAVRDEWVLIAAPVNHDGYRDVGEGLKAALRRKISGSYLALPQRRIEHALSLMRRDPKTALSPPIAREVALRDGRVSALLVPRVERLGDAYVLSVEIIDPNNDQLVAYPGEKIDNLQTILPAFEQLADEISAGLLLLPGNPGAHSLPQVTTSSMSALQLYSQAYGYLEDDQPLVAMELLDLAVREDPKFASAHALQAWALKRQGANKETYVQIAKEAMVLSTQVTPSERYFIEGSYRHLSGDLINADASYRALLEIKPDHLLGARAMLELCLDSKPPGGCVTQKVRLANIRPGNFEFNLQAAWSLAAEAGNVELATDYADKSLAIWRKANQNFLPGSVARALIFPVFSAWGTGDIEGALQKSQQLTEVLPTLPVDARNILIEHLVEFSTVLGRLNEAENLLERLSDSKKRHELRARFLFASGEKGELKNYLASDTAFDEQVSALLMAISGLPEEAMELHDELRNRGMSDARGAVIRARVAFGNGVVATAESELQGAVTELTLEDQAFYFVGHDLLAAVLKSNGQLAEAIHVLERTTQSRDDAAFNESALYWMMCQGQLARLYREADRENDAILIEDELRELLLLADNDFPLLLRLGAT
jgi:tetratricopeptide (TPR) repeat protein